MQILAISGWLWSLNESNTGGQLYMPFKRNENDEYLTPITHQAHLKYTEKCPQVICMDPKGDSKYSWHN